MWYLCLIASVVKLGVLGNLFCHSRPGIWVGLHAYLSPACTQIVIEGLGAFNVVKIA